MVEIVAKLYDSSIDSIHELNSGRINNTYLVKGASQSFILQKINTHVFTKPRVIINNYKLLYDLLSDKSDFNIPEILKNFKGEFHTISQDGGFWKATEYIDESVTYQKLKSPEDAIQIGAYLGKLHGKLINVNLESFENSLDNFHETKTYIQKFWKAFEKKNYESSLELEKCFQVVKDFEFISKDFDKLCSQGALTKKIIHGDPKLENFLFCSSTGKILTLVDWDTLGPGYIYHDLGDCLRSLCNIAGEDETLASKVKFDEHVFENFILGYKQSLPAIGKQELDFILLGVQLITFELGLRFLTDHLEGDRYFRVDKKGMNLSRASIQFALLKDIVAKKNRLTKILHQ